MTVLSVDSDMSAGDVVDVGSCWPSVDTQMDVTFSSKKHRKSSVSLHVGVMTSAIHFSRCSNAVINLQSFVGELPV